MKKPYFDEIERQIMREDDSLLAARMLMFIAMGKFKKELMKTPLLKAIRTTLNLVDDKH